MLLSSYFRCILPLLATTLGHPARRQVQSKTIDLSSFRMKSSGSYVSVSAAKKRSIKHGTRATNLETATSFLEETFPNITFALSNDRYISTNGVEHFYFKQTINNVIDIDNADINVNVSSKIFRLDYTNSNEVRLLAMVPFSLTDIPCTVVLCRLQPPCENATLLAR